MRYAIIGKGFIFSRHVDAIKDIGGEVVATCDINPKTLPTFTDYRKMLRDPIMDQVDAVSICTPNHLHAEMVRACLATGKRVLCEKPLTINTDFSLLDGASVVLQLRYHPKFNEICEAMRVAKTINIVLRAYRDNEFWSSWKGDEAKSGGVVYVLGAHIFDLLVCALGEDWQLFTIKDGVKKSYGVMTMSGVIVNFSLEFLDNRQGQTRHIEIDGKKFILSLKDNLSFEGLHDKVYKAFEAGTAPTVSSVIPSLRLIDAIKKYNR